MQPFRSGAPKLLPLTAHGSKLVDLLGMRVIELLRFPAEGGERQRQRDRAGELQRLAAPQRMTLALSC